MHSATVRGLGRGRNHHEDVCEFMGVLAPLLDNAVPVGLRAVFPDLFFNEPTNVFEIHFL